MLVLPLPVPDPAEPSPLWTEPILSEETRARLEHFRQLGWLPPNYKPRTLRGLAVVEGYWRRQVIVVVWPHHMLTDPYHTFRYCVHMNVDYVEFLLTEDPPTYMNFFD